MFADYDTDAVLEWIGDGQPAYGCPDFAAVAAAEQRGLIVSARGGGFVLTEDGEFEAQALSWPR